MQYVGDLRLEALTQYVMTRDDRLTRKALFLVDASRHASGLTESRYPVREPQFIPWFSLRLDRRRPRATRAGATTPASSAPCCPACAAVLEAFLARRVPDGRRARRPKAGTTRRGRASWRRARSRTGCSPGRSGSRRSSRTASASRSRPRAGGASPPRSRPPATARSGASRTGSTATAPAGPSPASSCSRSRCSAAAARQRVASASREGSSRAARTPALGRPHAALPLRGGPADAAARRRLRPARPVVARCGATGCGRRSRARSRRAPTATPGARTRSTTSSRRCSASVRGLGLPAGGDRAACSAARARLGPSRPPCGRRDRGRAGAEGRRPPRPRVAPARADAAPCGCPRASARSRPERRGSEAPAGSPSKAPARRASRRHAYWQRTLASGSTLSAARAGR